MIDHEHYRRALLADPSLSDSELTAHRNACPQCSAFTDRLVSFEQRLALALKVPITTGADILSFTRRSAPPAQNRRWFALAASVLISLGVAPDFWLAAPRSTLAAEVVAHMAEEPDAWNTHDPIPGRKLAAVLAKANMRLDPHALAVTYTNSCEFRGHIVPHLVVQTSQGPVTAMVLVHERVAKPKEFDEYGYRGTIVPVPNHGSLAVLMRAPRVTIATVDAIASQVRSAIVWGPQEDIASDSGKVQLPARQ